MRVYSLSGSVINPTSDKKNLSSQKTKPNVSIQDAFVSNSKRNFRAPSFSFRGAPWRLDIGSLSEKTAKEACSLFDKLKLGNYLDLNGKVKDLNERAIRNKNLSFIDCIANDDEKKKFIDYYKNLTGFPNLKKVGEKIENEFVKAVNKAESLFSYNEAFSVQATGYDGVSSVAKRKCIPGSDLDKAFVLLKGTGNLDRDKDIVNEFSGKLWENTDQRILSYNHDTGAFPKVYTKSQVDYLMKHVNKFTRTNSFTKFIASLFMPDSIIVDPAPVLPSPISNYFINKMIYEGSLKTYNEDYVQANPFFVELCQNFPLNHSWELNKNLPSRENMYTFGFFLEALAKGKHFRAPVDIDDYVSSKAAKYINASQIEALKNSNGFKSKYEARERLQTEFDTWPVAKQLDFVKEMIKASCNDSEKYTEYFASTEDKRFNKLMKEMGLEEYISEG